MSKGRTLGDVRADIDAIDDTIHDLLIRRTELVEEVRSIKSDWRVKIQPSREAEIIYRLVERHRGPFPKRDLIAVWRILICATLSFEGPFSAAVAVPESDPGYWDIARDHFGPCTPMSRHVSPRAVIEAVHRQDATVGVLPMPRGDDADPWWPHIVSSQPDAPKVIARLPFAGIGNARAAGLDALVICPVTVVPTGRDRSLLVIDAAQRIGLAQAGRALQEAGFDCTLLNVWGESETPPNWLYLIEVDGWLAADDPRLPRLRQGFGGPIVRLLLLGGYARPLSPESLARSPLPAHGEAADEGAASG
jgi:chorismate mutase / prephenate dehydratase